MLKKLLKIFSNLITSILIALISISIIILTVVLLITKYDVFLRYTGIYVEKKCKFEKGSFYCSYYNVSDREKNFSLRFKNLSGSIVLENFFRNREILNVKAESVSGYINIKKSSKQKRTSLPVNILYFTTKLVNFELESGDLEAIQKNRRFYITDLNFKTINSSISISKPVHIESPDFYADIKKLNIKLTPVKVFFKTVQIDLLKGIELDASGFVSSEFRYVFSGLLHVKDITLYENNIKDGSSFFRLKGKENILNVKAIYRIGQINNKEERAVFESIYGSLKGRLLNRFAGVNHLDVEDIKVLEVFGRNISTVTDFSIGKEKKLINSSIKVELLKFGKYTIPNISSEFHIEKEDNTSVTGKINTDLVNAEFFYSDINEPVFKFSTDKFKLSKIIDFINPPKRELYHLYSILSVNFEYRPVSDTATIKVTGEKINLFGVPFKQGNFSMSIKVEKNEAGISGQLYGKHSNLFIAGKFRNRYINVEYNYSNIDLKNLIFTKKAGFSSVVSGKGFIRGNFPNVEILAYGLSSNLSYKEIKLQGIDYALFYKNRQLTVVGKKEAYNLTTNVFVKFKPFSMLIDIYGNNSYLKPVNPYLRNLLPAVFSKLELVEGTGNVKVFVKKKYWKVDLNVESGKLKVVPIKEYLHGNASGFISKESSNLVVNFHNRNMKLYDIKTSILGRFELLNRDFFVEFRSDYLENTDKFELFGFIFTQLKEKRVSGVTWISAKEKEFRLKSKTLISGSFKKIGGISNISVLKSAENILSTTVNYIVNLKDEIIDTVISARDTKIVFSKKEKNPFLRDINFLMKNVFINGKIEKSKPPKFSVEINKLLLSKGTVPFLSADRINVEIYNREIHIEPLQYTGFLTGKLKYFRFNIPDRTLKFLTEGSISKELIPQILQFFSLSGEIRYTITYDGTVEDFSQKIVVQLKSKDLKIKTPYIIGKIVLDNFLVQYKKSLTLDITGRTINTLYGENPVTVNGTVSIRPLQYDVFLKSEMLPVRYENIFVGTASTDINITGKKGTNAIKGRISLSGRSKLSPFIFASRKEVERPEFLENILVDISVDTFSPIYVYGNWGNVYAEGSLHITGTARKPLLNGEINITYGKIYIAKNLYNVDFINIRIIDNKPFINARLSTTVAQTFIYLNISGPIDDLQFDYVSTPPKTKEEILAMLFLKETPSALAELPVFALIGKVIRAFFPASAEGTGLFRTGFEITINPKYSPVQGIIASIYARKSITRRLYIALSRPILQTITELGGWYELGFKLTERTAIVFRRYETNITETEITFTLPFDF